MTTKERLHELVDELSELEADDALRILIARHKNGTGETVGTLESNGALGKTKKRRRLSFSGIGASDASDVSARFDEYLGRAIDARHPRS